MSWYESVRKALDIVTFTNYYASEQVKMEGVEKMSALEDATARARLHAEHMEDVQAMLLDFAGENDLGFREEIWLRLKDEFRTAAGAARNIALMLAGCLNGETTSLH